VLAAIGEEHARTGRWPTYDGWAPVDETGRRPTAQTVFVLFETWTRAITVAKSRARTSAATEREQEQTRH
jgi:hypothetical protein